IIGDNVKLINYPRSMTTTFSNARYLNASPTDIQQESLDSSIYHNTVNNLDIHLNQLYESVFLRQDNQQGAMDMAKEYTYD
ncbi:hypothetical protein Bhyg_03818, partial [Pseudolycoriella hygida]